MINFNNIIGTYYFQKNMLGIYLSKFRQYYLIDNEDDIVKEIIKNKSAFTTYRIVSNNFFFLLVYRNGVVNSDCTNHLVNTITELRLLNFWTCGYPVVRLFNLLVF